MTLKCKLTVIHSYNGILLNNKKEHTIDIYNNMDQSQIYFALWKKWDPKGNKLYMYNPMSEFPEGNETILYLDYILHLSKIEEVYTKKSEF